jgi:Glycosyl transferase family 2
VKLSVLMPVYNEAATLAAAVKRVLDVEYPCDMELVIVDDGSTDGAGRFWLASRTIASWAASIPATGARGPRSGPP